MVVGFYAVHTVVRCELLVEVGGVGVDEPGDTRIVFEALSNIADGLLDHVIANSRAVRDFGTLALAM